MNGVVCRIFNTYGARSGAGHAVRSLIHKALDELDPFPIWGDGQQTRGFTYVADVVTGLLLCTELTKFTILNLGNSSEIAVIDLVREIFRVLEWSPQAIHYQLDKPNGTSGRVANSERCLEMFGWQPATPLTTGLERTIRWCREVAG